MSSISLRQDLLSRLHWPIFSPLTTIQFLDTNGTLVPFTTHPLASIPLASTPLNKLHVLIDTCSERAAHDEGDGGPGSYIPPEPLIFSGSPITLLDFVVKTHGYLNAHREDIVECEEEVYDGGGVRVDGGGRNILDGKGFWFDFAGEYGVEEDEVDGQVFVGLWVEGNGGVGVGEWWGERRREVEGVGGSEEGEKGERGVGAREK